MTPRTPAPQPTATGPVQFPDPPPSGPFPHPTVDFKACGCTVLDGEQCDCAEVAAQWQAELARPIHWSQTGGRWTAVA